MSIFNQVQITKPKRNVFNLSHDKKLSMSMGDLVPILCQEVLPGDSFQVNTESLIRLAPLISPMMHRVNVSTHFFFVPNRLVWNDWETFITGGQSGTLTPVHPTIETKLFLQTGSLADYFGIPVLDPPILGTHKAIKISALPFRAYQLIYNEYFRDQTLQDEVLFSLDSGNTNDEQTLLTLRKRCWEKDYYTSSLPFAQRGAEVRLPLTGNAPIISTEGNAWNIVRNPDGSLATDTQYLKGAANTGYLQEDGGQFPLRIDPNGTLEADLQNVTAATIVELRRASRLQEWLEKNARAGYRYIEQIFSHFGVKSSDARLQRPEYLGGGKTPILISEVLQTSSTDSTSPQANMSGHGVSAGNTHQFKRNFEEHGFIIGIMSVLPKTTYQQGIPRQYVKFDKFDYFWPEFANIGEQPVFNSEVYHDYSSEFDYEEFGYQSRYCEYKYTPSSVHGDFRNTLLFWHMGRKFDSKPMLNSSFVEANPTERVFAVEDNSHKLYVQLHHNIKAIRPLPYFSNPSL